MPRLRLSDGRTFPVGISRTHSGHASPVGASGRTIASSRGYAARCAASAATHRRSMSLEAGQAITAVTAGGLAGIGRGSSDL